MRSIEAFDSPVEHRQTRENPEYTKRDNILFQIVQEYSDTPYARDRVSKFIDSDTRFSSQSAKVRELFPAAARYRVLTHEDRIKLFEDLDAGVQAYEQSARDLRLPGAAAAHDVLVASNLGLVAKVLGHFNFPENYETDLAQVGAIGLIKAVRRFDLSNGSRFSSYAMHWIQSTIRRRLTEHRAVHIPLDIEVRLARVREAIRKLNDNQNGLPDIDDIYEQALKFMPSNDKPLKKQDVTEIIYTVESLVDVMSLDSGFDKESDKEQSMLDFIPDPNSADPIEQLSPPQPVNGYTNLIKELADKSDLLPPEGRFVSLASGVYLPSLNGKKIKTSGGLVSYDELIKLVPQGGFTISEIADLLCMTEAHVIRTKNQVVEKMRTLVKEGVVIFSREPEPED